jgi:hypothetical protein
MKRSGLIALGYIVAMSLWIYGVVDPSLGFGSDTAAAVGIAALGAFHVAVGYALGRGWAPLLVLAVPLIAYPAGYADRGEFLIWIGAMIFIPLGALLLFAGVAVRHALLGARARTA